jgi:hypothetical protein
MALTERGIVVAGELNGRPALASFLNASEGDRIPTSKDQCKNGGWRNFPEFKNQGRCIVFVNHGP